MTNDEINLIQSGDVSVPFRVLTINSSKDSILLRTKCADVDVRKDIVHIKTLIERLKITMEAESGVGIAAPQVGILRNVFLFTRIDKPEKPVEVAINPRIINYSPEKVCFERDGCLSIPDQSGNSLRYKWVEVEYLNEKGETIREKLTGYERSSDFTGIIFQHEFDHLNGILYTDRPCNQQ